MCGVRADPLFNRLPYWKFGLHVPQHDIPNLERILRAVTPEELRQLRHYHHLHHSSFCWYEGPGLPSEAPLSARAYEAMLDSIKLKIYSMTFKA